MNNIPDRETSFFETTVSGDIAVDICYNGMLIVDGKEVCNIFDIIKQLNDKLLDVVDSLYSQL